MKPQKSHSKNIPSIQETVQILQIVNHKRLSIMGLRVEVSECSGTGNYEVEDILAKAGGRSVGSR